MLTVFLLTLYLFFNPWRHNLSNSSYSVIPIGSSYLGNWILPNSIFKLHLSANFWVFSKASLSYGNNLLISSSLSIEKSSPKYDILFLAVCLYFVWIHNSISWAWSSSFFI